MCGKDFCAQCTPTKEINDYIEGRQHVLPTFGDNAQHYVTIDRRRTRFMQMLAAYDPAVVDWPEYRKCVGLSKHIDRLLIRGKFLIDGTDTPESLRQSFRKEKERILKLKNPNRARRMKANDRRRVLRNWIRTHLAEAEQLILGQIYYARQPEPKSTTSLIQQLGLENIVTPAVAEQRELVAA